MVDQAFVLALCEEHYPGESAAKKVVNLLEEATELGCALGVGGPAMLKAVMLTITKSDDPPGIPDASERRSATSTWRSSTWRPPWASTPPRRLPR